MMEMQNAYWLTNVRLETGYKFNNEVVTGTETALHHLLIKMERLKRLYLRMYRFKQNMKRKMRKNCLCFRRLWKIIFT